MSYLTVFPFFSPMPDKCSSHFKECRMAKEFAGDFNTFSLYETEATCVLCFVNALTLLQMHRQKILFNYLEKTDNSSVILFNQ
jgi:hypothetical protein